MTQQVHCINPCNLCASTEVAVLANHSRGGKPLRTVICCKCGLVWSDPFPHNPRNFYEDDYRDSYKGTYAPKPKHILRAGKVALSRHQKIAQFLTQPLTILDVGSGGGEFCYLLQSLGHDVIGIEPNKGYAGFSISEYNLNIKLGFIQDASLEAESFDLITIWHVFEHTENPSAVLAKLQALLKPEGLFVIEVPNIEATCQSPQSTFHEAHLFNFNLPTLRKIIEKSGFIVTEQLVSEDGGNISLIAQKQQSALATHDLEIPGNCNKITSIVRAHRSINHYLSKYPYVRLAQRICQAFAEKRALTGFTSGKQLLDQLYSDVIKNLSLAR